MSNQKSKQNHFLTVVLPSNLSLDRRIINVIDQYCSEKQTTELDVYRALSAVHRYYVILFNELDVEDD